MERSNFLLLDSDIVFDGKILDLLINSGYDSSLALKTGVELGYEEIKVKLRNDNSIIEISKEVLPNEAAGESIGIEMFSAEFSQSLFEVLDQMIIEERQENVFYEAAFQRVIDAGMKIFAVPVKDNYCMEIDFAEDLKEAEKLVASEKANL